MCCFELQDKCDKVILGVRASIMVHPRRSKCAIKVLRFAVSLNPYH